MFFQVVLPVGLVATERAQEALLPCVNVCVAHQLGSLGKFSITLVTFKWPFT